VKNNFSCIIKCIKYILIINNIIQMENVSPKKSVTSLTNIKAKNTF